MHLKQQQTATPDLIIKKEDLEKQLTEAFVKANLSAGLRRKLYTCISAVKKDPNP